MKFAITAVAATLSLIMAAGMTGSFFVFSTGVMPGLNGSRPASAIDAMQAINQRIQNPLFIGMFLLLPVFAAVAGILLMTMDEKTAGVLFLAAAAVYVLGALVPSFAVNIPMNNALDGVHIPHDPAEAARIWAAYSARWTAWNTVRAVFSWVGLLAMGAGAYLWGGNG